MHAFFCFPFLNTLVGDERDYPRFSLNPFFSLLSLTTHSLPLLSLTPTRSLFFLLTIHSPNALSSLLLP